MRERGSGRADGAARLAALAQGQQRAESVKAQRLIDEFVATARERGLAPEPLRARLPGGAEVKTDKSGWYLRQDRSVAIGEGGEYYVLIVPGGLAERLLRCRAGRLSPAAGGRPGRARRGGAATWPSSSAGGRPRGERRALPDRRRGRPGHARDQELGVRVPGGAGRGRSSPPGR